MPYTAVTKPPQGQATRKPTIDAMIDNDAFFASVLSSLNWLQIPNGSFEIDTDADGTPDLWAKTLYTGGSFALTGNLLSDTECRHGARAIKFTSPGGGGNGGGYIQSTEYNEVEPERPVLVSWLQKSTVTNIRNKVEILWFDANRGAISTTTIYTSITNPTSWTHQWGAAKPPSTARYCQVKITGAENTTTVAGSVYFDDVKLVHFSFTRQAEFITAGSWQWTAPTDVYLAEYSVIGGGGGAGSTASGASGGGGGGGMAWGFVAVVPGTSYAIVVGAGGTASAGTNGGAGGNSTLIVGATTYTGGGGSGGLAAGGGGAGGTGTNGDVNTTGQAGGANVGSTGGYGGAAVLFGIGVPGALNNNNGVAGPRYGAGGSGNGGGAGNTGGAGAPGTVLLRW